MNSKVVYSRKIELTEPPLERVTSEKEIEKAVYAMVKKLFG